MCVFFFFFFLVLYLSNTVLHKLRQYDTIPKYGSAKSQDCKRSPDARNCMQNPQDYHQNRQDDGGWSTEEEEEEIST